MCATAACSDGDTSVITGDGLDGPVHELTRVPGDGASEFVSGFGNDGNGNQRGDALSDASASGAAGAANSPAANADAAPSDGDGAARAISEADVLQLEGDRLYALSRYNGLTIVDVSDPARLAVEGVYRAAAEPFEMYVEDGIVFAMFNGWYSYECDAVTGGCSWQTTSRMQALDTRNPADIRLMADEQVPGSISDSRRVGDVLYLATVESGYCWGCDVQLGPRFGAGQRDPRRMKQLSPLHSGRLAHPSGGLAKDLPRQRAA
jgi:hypothetical protein